MLIIELGIKRLLKQILEGDWKLIWILLIQRPTLSSGILLFSNKSFVILSLKKRLWKIQTNKKLLKSFFEAFRELLARMAKICSMCQPVDTWVPRHWTSSRIFTPPHLLLTIFVILLEDFIRVFCKNRKKCLV